MGEGAGMTLEEARAIHRDLPVRGEPRDRNDDYAWDRAFDAASASVQDPFRQAMVVFLDQGTPQEQRLAQGFFATHRVGREEATRLAALYTERGWDTHHPVARLMHFVQYQIAEPERAALRRIFVADPLKHSVLAPLALMGGKTGPAWDAFALMVRATSDVAGLDQAYQAAFAGQAMEEFFALLKGRPGPVLRALAKTMVRGDGERLLSANGLQPVRRLPRAEVVARIAARRACLVQATSWGPEPGDRFALYVDGPLVKVVDYDPAVDRVRRLTREPASAVAEVVGWHTAAEIDEDHLASLDALDATFLKAVARREAREREVRKDLGDPKRWFCTHSQWKGMEGRFRHSPVLGWHTLGLQEGLPVRGQLHAADTVSFLFNVKLYDALDQEVQPIPHAALARIEAAEVAFAEARRRLQAGQAAACWVQCAGDQVVAVSGDEVWYVGVSGARILYRGERLNESWKRMFFDSLVGSALCGDLAGRLVPLSAA
jgi:hypothetical protein